MSAGALTGSQDAVVDEPRREPGAAFVRAGLLRRVAAAWVDGFALYAASSFLIAVAALAGVRLALGPTMLILGMGYGVASLGWFGGRTLGKSLWGLAVARRDGGQPGWTDIGLREAVGKWIVLGCAPGIVGRLVFRQSWVPTAYDLLSVIPMLFLTWLFYLGFRKTWYDQLAGTTVLRRPATPAAIRNALLLLLGMAVLGGGVKLAERVTLRTLPSRTLLYYGMGSTVAHDDFLKRTTVSPNDYIFGLFERYDLVVLCERAHSEATQWDFIFDLVKDPRFNQRVGHVFTELGQTGMQVRLDAFMAADGLSETEINERTLEIMRHWAVWPCWQRVNFPTYLKRLYALNQSLPPARRVQHHFTDVAVDWPNLTKEKMPEHWRSLANRDEKMAQVIVNTLKQLETARGGPVKGLVIMNYRHAFDLTGNSPQAPRYNTCEFLRDALKSRVANVRMNEDLFWPVAGGLWNEAFAKNGNRPTGFDLAGSPFGTEPFDLFPWSPALRGRLKYQDVFTGFVFINPPSAQYFLDRIPGYYHGWETEMRRRAQLFGEDWVKTIEQEISLEQQGRVPVKTPHIVFKIETWLAAGIGGFFAIGLALGLVAVGFGKGIQAPQSAR